MRWTPRALIPVAVGLFIIIAAGVAQALPATTPDNTGMVDFPGAGGSSNAVAVRTIAQSGNNIWVGGIFTEIDDSNGAKVQDANNLAVFNATSGSVASGVHVPSVTLTGDTAEVYDSSVGPDGNLYFAGNFDAVDGQTRHNVAAINATTGALTSFAPNAASANSVLATASAIYVGTGKLLSFQLNGAPTPGYTPPIAIIDASLRAHTTIPQFRDIAIQGNTLVSACQCDSITDAVGTHAAKAVVEINATNGNWINWIPEGLDASSGAFGITAFVHAFPGTGTPTVYLAAGGSDFTAAYDLAATGAGTNKIGNQEFKEDTSGSSQTVVWYQGYLVVGGHFNWTLKNPGSGASCQDNADPNPQFCWHTPKLTAFSASNGNPMLDNTGNPWNPGLCCKYNGVWALLVGNDGSTLHVGGEFTKAGGTWVDSPLPDPHGLNWNMIGGSTQQYYARFGGPAANTQTLTVQKSYTAGATGTVTSSPSGISCNASCTNASFDFPTNQMVTLTETPSAGDTFLGWSSSDAGFSCPGTPTTCQVTMNTARTVTAAFAGVTFQLSVTKTGNAAGTASVTSNVGGINCGATCSALIQQNTVVTLTAAPGPNSVFNGWSGSGCTGTGTCVVTMTAAKSVSADFSSTLASLTVNKTSTTGGFGTVTSNPTGISCANTCTTQTAPFSSPTVTLSETPKMADAFAGWSSSDPNFSCPGLGDCTVTMDQSRTVVADFENAHNVKLTMAGTGGGVVSSTPAAMNCAAPGPECDQAFADTSTVTLTATPDANSVFTGWSSTGNAGTTFVSCTGTAPCTFNMGTNAKLVTATFQPAFPLTVTPAGFGSGTVTSNPAGINCGLTCGPTNFQSGSNVILSAVADPSSSTFAGWSGGLCTGTGTCAVPMTQARNVTATFDLIQRPLTAHVVGHGTLTTDPSSTLDCVGPQPDSGTCNTTFSHGDQPQILPTPDLNWEFTGWSGDCTGTGDCVLTMTASHDVTATFEQIQHSINVTLAGSGTGTVTSSPDAGIACPGDCAEGFGQGDSESLLQAANPGSVFTGWSGDCTGTGACNLTIDGEKNVTATFELIHHLTVTTDGGGTGNVTSDVGGISCPGTCTSTDLAHNTHVILTETADPGFAFAGWSSDDGCTGTAPTCDVLMDNDHTVTAEFEPAETLTVSTSGGSATGTVTTPPNNEINCPSTCAHDFAVNASVTLHAVAGPNAVFTGWSGDTAGGCLSTGDCTVTMDQARTVTASFQPTWALNVTLAGSGGGTVTSDVGGISCNPTCDQQIKDSTEVTLSAVADANSTFTGWSGETCSGTGTCVVEMTQDRNVTATFAPILWQLSITKSGTGTGGVTSLVPNPGIDCGATCQLNFQQGSSVTLHATPDASSVFTGWSGGGCAGTSDCTVSISSALSVNAQFDLAQRLLTVTKAGNGAGSVSSDDAGAINCPGTCGASYPHGTGVVLTEHLGLNSVFTGWSGDCAGSGTNTTCSLTMDGAKNVTATFVLVQHALSITKSGTGTGIVTSDVGLINCGANCSVNYDHGTVVHLTATPDANVNFVSWGGACSGTGTCTVTMNADTSVSATFNLIQHTLTVTKAGTGTGQITGTGINCPGTCTANYDHGTVVALSATPSGGGTFAGWTGACTGTGACSITMNTAMAVTGTFNPPVTATTLKDSDPAVAYNGWFGVADVNANGGFYRMSNIKNDKATWISPVTTSITWVTRTGPDQGKASVTIDGVNKGTVDLYTASAAASNQVYSGLANKAHTIVVKVLHTKNAASSNYNVRLDAFVVGATTTQESDPKIQYDSWKSTAQAAATDGTYRVSATNTATVTVNFTGTSIDWKTTKGKAYGKASVKVDGVSKGTFDMYQSATAWQSVITFGGLSSGSHTLVIQVLGQKNASATSNNVVVDGFIVHA